MKNIYVNIYKFLWDFKIYSNSNLITDMLFIFK